MVKDNDPAKGIVFIVILAIIVSGFLFLSSMLSEQPTSYAECVEAGYPIVIDNDEKQCMISSKVFTEQND